MVCFSSRNFICLLMQLMLVRLASSVDDDLSKNEQQGSKRHLRTSMRMAMSLIAADLSGATKSLDGRADLEKLHGRVRGITQVTQSLSQQRSRVTKGRPTVSHKTSMIAMNSKKTFISRASRDRDAIKLEMEPPATHEGRRVQAIQGDKGNAEGLQNDDKNALGFQANNTEDAHLTFGFFNRKNDDDNNDDNKPKDLSGFFGNGDAAGCSEEKGRIGFFGSAAGKNTLLGREKIKGKGKKKNSKKPRKGKGKNLIASTIACNKNRASPVGKYVTELDNKVDKYFKPRTADDKNPQVPHLQWPFEKKHDN